MRWVPASVQRWLAILMPPLAIAICCFVMIPQHGKLRNVESETDKAQAAVQDYLAKLKAVSDLPENPRVATLPFSRQEQSDFLRDLATLCYRSGNRIIAVRGLALQNGADVKTGAGKKKDSKEPVVTLPAGVAAIESSIVFEGKFPALRAFLSSLEKARRMVSLNECNIIPGRDGHPSLQTTLSVIRYVDSPVPATPPAQAAKSGSAGSAS